jgi:carboxylesterase type B
MEKPDIKPIKLKEYGVKQSKYPQVGQLPIRSVLLAASGGGKTVLIQNMILDIYKGLFERVYIFSPSIHVDHTWEPVKEYLKHAINLKDDEPEIYYDHYDPEALAKIIDTQRKVIEFQKSKKETKRLFQILIIIDDFADDPAFSRHSKLLHSLFIRGRHSQISTIVATQKFTALHPIIRVNASELYVFRLRNYQDLQTFIDEVSAIVDKKSLLEMYNLATNAPYSFLYCKLTSKDKSKIFMVKFDQYLVIEDN